jgi:hypothetical protein
VEVQQAAERFFGVDNLADVTREMLDAARAALLPLDKATQVWQTHVIVTVLSQGDFPTSKMSLEDIARQIDEGDWIGTVNMRAPIRVPPENVRPLLLSIGNDGTFFGDAPDDVDTAAPPMNPAPTARSGLRETLEDIRQWIKTGMIDDVHYDEASVMAQIDAALAANPVGQATAAKRAELQPTPGMRLIEVRSLAALKRALAVPGAMVRVLENTYLARQPDGQAALDRQK